MTRDLPCITPLRDTWRGQQHAASWMWEPPGQPEPLNPGSAARLEAVLQALHPLARLREISFEADAPPLLPVLRWESGSSADFTRRVLAELAAAQAPITNAEARLDLYVWVRVAGEEAPIQGWLSRAARLDATFEHDSPYIALALDHTLFRDGNAHGPSNHALHSLNAPALRSALAAVDRILGPATEIEGLPDVTRWGFSSWQGGTAPG